VEEADNDPGSMCNYNHRSTAPKVYRRKFENNYYTSTIIEANESNKESAISHILHKI
jgi:hypothetical protein